MSASSCVTAGSSAAWGHLLSSLPLCMQQETTQHGSRSTGCTHTHLKTETCKQQHTKKSRTVFRLKMNMFCCGWGRGTRLHWRAGLFFISTLGTHSHICPVYENDIDTTQQLHVEKTYTVASKKIQPHTNVGPRHLVKFYANVTRVHL